MSFGANRSECSKSGGKIVQMCTCTCRSRNQHFFEILLHSEGSSGAILFENQYQVSNNITSIFGFAFDVTSPNCTFFRILKHCADIKLPIVPLCKSYKNVWAVKNVVLSSAAPYEHCTHNLLFQTMKPDEKNSIFYRDWKKSKKKTQLAYSHLLKRLTRL